MTNAVCDSGIAIKTPVYKRGEGTFKAYCSDKEGTVNITFEAAKSRNEVPFQKVYLAAKAYAKKLGLEIPSKEEIISSIANKDSYDPKKDVVIGSLSIQARSTATKKSPSHTHTERSFSDSVAISTEAREETTKVSPNGPRYRTAGDKQTRLESNRSYVHILKDSYYKPQDIRDEKMKFAEQIFRTLQARGIIKGDGKLKTWYGASRVGDILNKIFDLVGDKDYDGTFDVDGKELLDALKKSGCLNNKDVALSELADSISNITNRYFEDSGSAKVLEHYQKYGKSNVEKSTAEVMLRQLHSAGEAKKTSSPITKMSVGQFIRYVQANYRGKLNGDPKLQERFRNDVDTFLKSRFVGAVDERGAQLDIDEDFMFNFNNLERLSRDSQGRYRGNCKTWAQASAMIFRAAGLEVRYYGSSITKNGRPVGHVQALGYIKGSDFMIANNNDGATTSSKPFSPSKSRELLSGMLEKYFGKENKFTLSEGYSNTSKVSAFLKQMGHVSSLQAGLDEAAKSYPKDESRVTPANVSRSYLRGLENIRNNLSVLKAHADKVTDAITLTIDGNKRTFNKSQLLAYINDMDNKYAGLIERVRNMVA